MDRIYMSGAALTAPDPPDPPSSGYPINGNPGTGTAATVPGAHWFHQITEEIAAVIEAANITLDGEDYGQLLEAIQTFGVSSYLLQQNGYAVLGCGLIIQWGDASAITPGTVTFPLAFPNAVFVIVGTDSDSSAAAGSAVKVSKSQFSAHGELDFWIAIGW